MKISTLIVFAAMFGAGCANPLTAEVKTDKVCITTSSVTIAGANTYGTTVTASTTGTFDLSDVPALNENLSAITGNIYIVSFTFDTSNYTLTDLSGITQATIELEDPTDSSTWTDIIDYTNSSSDVIYKLAMTPNSTGTTTNLLDLFKEAGGTSLGYKATFTGTPPTSDWTADVIVCVSEDLTIDYTQL